MASAFSTQSSIENFANAGALPLASSSPLTPCETLVDGKVQHVSKVPTTFATESASLPTLQKYVLLSIFCLAEFIDTFNTSSLFSAIPVLSETMGITTSEAPWLISAFQLTFASFLLVSGKVSDVYNPKYAFILGSAALGAISIGTGFVNDKILLLVLRAFAGIAGAMTIPSALTLLVNIFPDPKEQARAIGVFGGFAAIGNVLGLVIGAIFVQFANWRWIFWAGAIACALVAAVGIILIPTQTRDVNVNEGKVSKRASKLRRLDIPGVSILTVALILFIFALTSATTAGWGSAMVLAPLILSITLFVGFFFWESRLSVDNAAIPSQTWFYTNFAVLFGVALFPFFWWTTVFTIFITLWQEVYGWSVISTALHLLPIGVTAFVLSFTGSLSRIIEPKYIILPAHVLVVIATILLAFADSPARYWPFAFPAFIIGSTGAMLTYTHTNIAIFRSAPTSMTGTVGAMFNAALQVGSAVGLAAVTSIQTSIDSSNGNNQDSFAGRAASFWFILAIAVIEGIAVLVFYRVQANDKTNAEVKPDETTSEKTISDSESGSEFPVKTKEDLEV